MNDINKIYITLTEERLEELFENSELVFQARKYFDAETCEQMIEELKTNIKKEK